MRLMLRPTEMDRDADRLAEIENEYHTEPVSPEALREKAKSIPEGWVSYRWTAELNGQTVGFTHLRRSSQMSPGTLLGTVAVAAAFRGTGIGNGLLLHAEADAKSKGNYRPMMMVRQDVPGAVGFFQKRGYETVFTLGESTADVTAWQPQERALPHGYRRIAWQDVEDTDENRRRLHRLVCECDKSEPGTKHLGLQDYESFLRDAFEPGCWRPDWIWIAEQGGEWVGVHNIKHLTDKPEDGHKANISFTGTLPSHRGQGIATALKFHGMNVMRAAGKTTLLTHNDTTNAPMLKVNDKLGVFTTAPGWAYMGKQL